MKLKSFLSGLSAAVLTAAAFISCQPEQEADTLSVSPDSAIAFAASGNTAVQLNVTTTASDWDFVVPEWIEASREGDVLTVNAKDNESEDENLGRITFTAGNAEPVRITVTQAAAGSFEPTDGVAAKVTDESGSNDVSIVIGKELEVSASLKLTLEEAAASDVNVTLAADPDYIAEYDYAHGTTGTIILPAEVLTADWNITVAAGQTEKTIEFTIDGNSLEFGVNYLLPLKAEVVSGDAKFVKTSDRRVNYLVKRKNPREIRQICVMEFNDTNPLNVLEWKLEDGSYFFDALVLFSGNICWSDEDQRVAFNKRRGEPVVNANTAALVAEAETLLKPIHDAGIPVYMGLMPHHTQAGLTNISNAGCKDFAIEMAELARDCYFSGYFLDEEYTGWDYGNMTEYWKRSSEDNQFGNGGSYMAYQLWKQAEAVCDWPINVSYFQYGGLSVSEVTDHEDNSKHDPSEFCSIIMPNYGGRGYPNGNQTLKDCCGASVELARWGSITGDTVKQRMEEGYGWIAWFAWDPVSRSGRSYIEDVAKVCYESPLVPPTHYYRKTGQGSYDSNRTEL